MQEKIYEQEGAVFGPVVVNGDQHSLQKAFLDVVLGFYLYYETICIGKQIYKFSSSVDTCFSEKLVRKSSLIWC